MKVTKKLALITLKYLYQNRDVLGEKIFLSLRDNQKIEKMYGKKIPRNFPDTIFHLLSSAIYGASFFDNLWKHGDHVPYMVDDRNKKVQIVFPGNKSFPVKQDNSHQITSTWKDLGDWMKTHVSDNTNLLSLWLDSDLSYDEFVKKHLHILRAYDLGLI